MMLDKQTLIEKYLSDQCSKDENRIVETFIVDLLDKYAVGAASAEEKEVVEKWLKNGKYTISNHEASELLHQHSAHLWHRINETKEASKVRASRRQVRTWLTYGTGIAAAIATLVITFNTSLFTLPSASVAPREVVADNTLAQQFSSHESIKRIQLADGTVIHLNQGSTLSLHQGKFNAHTREVWLDEGEAFFEVAKNPGDHSSCTPPTDSAPESSAPPLILRPIANSMSRS